MHDKCLKKVLGSFYLENRFKESHSTMRNCIFTIKKLQKCFHALPIQPDGTTYSTRQRAASTLDITLGQRGGEGNK